MKRVLVIVVTYNGVKWLERCLGSVASCDLFVVDNDSTDGSADWVQAHYPSAKLIRSAENLGFTAANNLGFDYALEKGYDYVYLLNQDAWLEEGALEKMLEVSLQNPEYAVLSPLQMTEGYGGMDREFGKILRCAQNDKVSPVGRVMAAHWLVSVEALRNIGKFSDLFPMWGQDDDWCNRARYHGYKIGIVREARAVHDRKYREEPKEKLIRRNYYMGSLVRLCNINRPLWTQFIYVIAFTLVKAVKYFSFEPFRYLRLICKKLPDLVSLRDYNKKTYGSIRHT